MFQAAARVIAELSSADAPSIRNGVLFPGLKHLRDISKEVAVRVCEVAERE